MGAGASSKKKDDAADGDVEERGKARGKVLETFQRFDRNGDGNINKEELEAVLTQVGKFSDEDCAAVLQLADKNKDGRIDYKEFTAWVFDVPASASAKARRPISLDYRQLLPQRFEVDISKRYALDKTTLGEGGYGKVFVAKDLEQESRIVVVKRVTKTGVSSHDELFRREIQIMKELDHPNICKLLGTYEQGNTIFFVMEYLEGGEVFDRIIAQKCISEEMTADVVRQVSSALRYAHGRGIAHRDVKPENVVFCNKDTTDSQVKLIDWGLAMTFTGSVMSEAVGSTTYTAPEVMDSKNVKAYSEACDLWSLGVLTYVMLSGKPPFWGSHRAHLEKARNESYPFEGGTWDTTSANAKDFISRLLKADPQRRMPIGAVLEHPWLTATEWPTPQINVSSSILANMKRFSNTSTFNAMCIAAVARQLDHKNLGNIHQVFRKMDKNGDGVLSMEEVASGFGEIFGEDSEEYQSAISTFKGLDLDGSEKVDYTEFCAGGIGQHTVAQEEACWAAFKTFDIDNTGALSKTELQKVLQSADLKNAWSEDVCNDVAQQVLEKHDRDKDGCMNFDEFMAMMRESRQRNDPLTGGKPSEAGAAVPTDRTEAARLCAYDMLMQMSSL